LRVLETPSVAVIAGNPGIGKTTLAVHVAHLLTGGHPDAQVYCDLRGVHAPADPAEVLAIEVQRSSASSGESPSRVNSTV
jgi:predicted ATPase